MSCPCGTGLSPESCCLPLHRGEREAATAEELMRSRYSAFVLGDIDYIVDTYHPDQRDEVDREGAQSWSDEADWIGLEIVSTEAGGADDDVGFVEFVARYEMEGSECAHHERARFEKVDGAWYFESEEPVKYKPVVRDEPKVGRNAPCPCGSGKKYKKCCG